MAFKKLGLIEPLLKAIEEEGYEVPTPIQDQAIGSLLAGKDLFGCAQTGTGKTAAFALPILQMLHESTPAEWEGKRPIRCLVVTPTRELAAQIGESFKVYGRHLPLRATTVFGGVRQQSQVSALKAGVDVLVATPGRLLDLMRQRHIDLSAVEIFVLDEGDRMLDMGFIDDIRDMVRKLPKQRQTLFSATIPESIQRLARDFCHDPVVIEITPDFPAAENVEQIVFLVEYLHKQELLEHLLADPEITRALIFTRTKARADRVGLHLNSDGIPCRVIHADKPQKHREKTLDRFKGGDVRVLVASDLASRGLDVDDISHVINFDLPPQPEVYVHRIGRTGRAGATGIAFSFCEYDERVHLEAIELLTGKPVHVITDHPWPSPLPYRHKARPSTQPKTAGFRRSRRPGRRKRRL